MIKIGVSMLLMALLLYPVTAASADVFGHIWTRAPRDFKTGYALAVTESYFLLRPDNAPPTDWVADIGKCIKKKDITPGQLIAMMDAYLKDHPEKEMDYLFTVATDSLIERCKQ